MTKPTPVDPDHEDGSWFLEAVGVKKRAPTSIESVAELEKENSLVDTPVVSSQGDGETDKPNNLAIELTSFSGDPGTSLSTYHTVPEPPPMPPNIISTSEVDRQSQPEQLTNDVNVLDDLNDTTLASALQTRRPFRWPSILAAALVIAVVGMAVLWLPRAANADANRRQEAYYDASLDVRTFLPSAQASLDVVTHPSSADADLASVIPVVSELSSHASNLETIAAEALPSALPLVPTDAIDALAPFRDRSAILASDTAEIARQVGHSYVYRTSIRQLLDVGELPATATTDEINALSVLLASLLADNASLVADLPSNDAFATVQAQAGDAVSTFGGWQEDYLEALADGDDTIADSLIADIGQIKADLIALTEETLLTFRTAMDSRMVALASEFDQHLDELTR